MCHRSVAHCRRCYAWHFVYGNCEPLFTAAYAVYVPGLPAPALFSFVENLGRSSASTSSSCSTRLIPPLAAGNTVSLESFPPVLSWRRRVIIFFLILHWNVCRCHSQFRSVWLTLAAILQGARHLLLRGNAGDLSVQSICCTPSRDDP